MGLIGIFLFQQWEKGSAGWQQVIKAEEQNKTAECVVHTKYLDGTAWLVFSGTFLHVMGVYSESYFSNTRLGKKIQLNVLSTNRPICGRMCWVCPVRGTLEAVWMAVKEAADSMG